MLWLVLTLLTAGAVVMVLSPVWRRRDIDDGRSREVEFYRSQIGEIDREVDRGQLPDTEADAARAEAGRRLMAAAARQGEPVAPRDDRGRALKASLIAAVLVPALGAGLYVYLGRPDLADQPIATRPDAPTPDPVEAALARVEADIVKSPDNVKAWATVAPVYVRLGHYEDAVNAYRQLLRLSGEDATLRADLGEAEVALAGGAVTPEAKADFERALTEAPGLPIARYYSALGAEQSGDKARAQAAYEALIPDLQDHPSWLAIVKGRLAALENGGAGGDSPAPAASASAGSEGQSDMIGAMVTRLATRLASSGGSAEEWKRLVRAYSVLHDNDKAMNALTSARAALASDPGGLASLNAMADELGLKSP